MAHSCPVCSSATNTSICASCAHELSDRGRDDLLPDPKTEVDPQKLREIKDLLMDAPWKKIG